MPNTNPHDIDFIITWVDMHDPEWQKDFIKYSGKESGNAVSIARFRDYGLIRYWFRAVEKFCPWVRKIHFVTCGQHPEWLDPDHPKLAFVDHEDYMPHEALPMFNSSLLELFFHKIPDLAEHFVYFNDDFFPISPIEPERFFQDGLPCDIAAFRYNSGIGLWSTCLKNNMRLINERFDKREILARDHDKWFHPSYGSKARLTRLMQWYPRFLTLRVPHNAQPYLKQTYQEVWDYAGEELSKMIPHRFRTREDYTQELFRIWQICRSNFTPYNTYRDTKMFPLALRSAGAIRAIREQSYKLICINDSAHIRNYDEVMGNIRDSFEAILPEPSSFER